LDVGGVIAKSGRRDATGRGELEYITHEDTRLQETCWGVWRLKRKYVSKPSVRRMSLRVVVVVDVE